MSHPLALTLPRPQCWLVCRGLAGTVRLVLTDAQRSLLAQDRLVLIHSGHVGSAEWHRALGITCRQAGVTPPERDALEHDVWRGVAQIVRVIESAQTVLHLRGLHLFGSPPYWGTPGPDAPRLWLPSAETAESLLDEWEREHGKRRAS